MIPMGRWMRWGYRATKHSNRWRAEVAIPPFEIQQWLRRSGLLKAQSLHLTNHDQMIARNVLGVNVAIEPVQAAANERVAQRRRAPFNAVPLVRTAPGELV